MTRDLLTFRLFYTIKINTILHLLSGRMLIDGGQFISNLLLNLCLLQHKK